MRYYDIQIFNEAGTMVQEFTSFVDGKTILGALDIEVDIPLYTQDAPVGAAYIKIWGVPLKMVGQASDFNGCSIKVRGGMQKGLPLANPQQAGLLLSGLIQQAFGNWQGTEQTIDLQVYAGLGSPAVPVNLVLDWKAGQPMGDALTQSLQLAYPGFTVESNINGNLILPHDEQGFHQSLQQLAQYANDASQNILGGSYPGVKISVQDTTIKVFDGSTPSGALAIVFNDLIGQPTWKAAETISFKTVMRADLQVGEYITMPQANVLNTSASYSQYRDKSAFQGTFLITFMRHIGRFRQKDANSWVTAFEAVTQGDS